jgi:hypothetical protein
VNAFAAIDIHAELDRYIAARRRVPFAWGSNDCCLFAADWVAIVLGRDVVPDLRGQYDSDIGAARLARARFGPQKQPDLFAVERWPEECGLDPVSPMFAQRGYLVSFDSRMVGNVLGVGLGVCTGRSAATPAAHGLTFIQLQFWRKAWRVVR